ncbi:MAG: hypothetical protein PHE18_06415, partial [Candidatus Omnitrophica bacterium]|nr:hypothetical protein [Candidatus Omnitrophota bacterium]
VGHLPYISKLASRLLTGSEDKPFIKFEQGSVLSLSNSEGPWEVKWFITPKLLSETERVEVWRHPAV